MANEDGLISFAHADMRYEPYPIAYVQPFIEPTVYETLVTSWPEQALFKSTAELGKKASLSERYNADNYFRFLSSSPQWARFHDFIKSDFFIEETLRFLDSKNVMINLDNLRIVSRKGLKRPSLLGRLKGQQEISARFEFSLMDAHGGSIRPHTDSPNKLITLVISMAQPGEWNDAWGGGTEICLPKDRTKIYNDVNRYMEFEDVDVIDRFPFVPNQCILFIKTYNSWHQVAPLRGPENAPMRRTLTVNIERIA
jgi:hypothetical protein